MNEDVFRCFQAIIEVREKPRFEKIIEGHTGFLFGSKLLATGSHALAKSGMNLKTLQYLMGHGDIGVALNTYAHLGLEDAENEFRRVEEYRRKSVAKEFGCDVMQITASDIGTLLYSDYGFKSNGNFMYYEI